MRIRFVPFSKVPYGDTCWSLIEGPDDCVYAASCNEHSSGGTAFVCRYNPRTEALDYLLDVAEVVGEPALNGRAPQCKIHYSLIVDDDGILYGATHLSGPAVDQMYYNPWSTFDDPARSYVGARFFAYDTAAEKVLWVDTLFPWEGCRCLALDRARMRLYAVGYPRDHFYVYDLRTRTTRDVGRIGSVNPQAIWLDARGRAYTTGDYGEVLVYDPETEDLVTTDISAPCAVYQDGWHNVVYDVVQAPGSEDVYGVGWNVDPHLFRFSPADDPAQSVMQDLGRALTRPDDSLARSINEDHVGGLVFAANGELLFANSTHTWGSKDKRDYAATVRAMDLETGRTRDVCRLIDEDGTVITYVSRAVRVGAEHLVMGTIAHVPVGVVHVTLDGELAEGPFATTPRRYWG